MLFWKSAKSVETVVAWKQWGEPIRNRVETEGASAAYAFSKVSKSKCQIGKCPAPDY